MISAEKIFSFMGSGGLLTISQMSPARGMSVERTTFKSAPTQDGPDSAVHLRSCPEEVYHKLTSSTLVWLRFDDVLIWNSNAAVNTVA
jgi:hypothetical protein